MHLAQGRASGSVQRAQFAQFVGKSGAPAAPQAHHSGLASLRSGEAAIRRASRTRARMGKDLTWRGPGGLTLARVGAVFHLCFARSSQIGTANFGSKISACLHGSRPIRDLEWKPWEPSKIKRTHRSRSFWLPRRRSAVFLRLLQAADCVPEMQHRGGDGLNGIVVQ